MFSLISMAAHCVSVISTSFVAISIVGMTVSTLPALQYQDDQVDEQIFQISQIFQDDDGGIKYFIFAKSPWKYPTMAKISNQGRTLDNPTLAMVETVSIAWYVGALYYSTTSKKVEMKLSTRQHKVW